MEKLGLWIWPGCCGGAAGFFAGSAASPMPAREMPTSSIVAIKMALFTIISSLF
jgi:hypothetical protein